MDLGSGARGFLNDRTGEVYSDNEDTAAFKPAPYEVTPFHFSPLKSTGQAPSPCSCCGGADADEFGECPLCDGQGSFQDPPLERAELWCPGSDSAYLLRHLLSDAECDEIIAQAESFGMESCGYNKRIRVNDRVSVMGDQLTDLLFERARPYLADVFVPDFRKGPEGCPDDMLRGLWQPAGLNPCFRVCRYSPGGFFAPHHDGGYDQSDAHRSIKTFMVYLNGHGDFEGGPTNFYNEQQQRYSPGLEENRIHALRPEKGSCLVFNHCITHDGGEVLGGNKYILRTEVMYRHRSAFDAQGDQLGEDSDSSFDHEGPGIDETLMD